LVFEIRVAHGDAVLDALVFANEAGAGDRALVGGLPSPERITTI
jgi:hypothetical protein